MSDAVAASGGTRPVSRLARQTPTPSGARGPACPPRSSAGPPPRLLLSTTIVGTAKRKLSASLAASRLLMPEDSLIPDLAVRTYVLLLLASPRADHSCSQPWRRSIFGPLFLPVTIVKTSTPLASTSLLGSAVINVGHSGQTTRSSAQGRLHRYAENMFGACSQQCLEASFTKPLPAYGHVHVGFLVRLLAVCRLICLRLTRPRRGSRAPAPLASVSSAALGRRLLSVRLRTGAAQVRL